MLLIFLLQYVMDQICRALYEHPTLASSLPLRQYIDECTRLSWSLVVQSPPLGLEYDATVYDPFMHERFYTSDNNSDHIAWYLWPSLLEKQTGKCISKGIVITGQG